jgi:hypothetical protein
MPAMVNNRMLNRQSKLLVQFLKKIVIIIISGLGDCVCECLCLHLGHHHRCVQAVTMVGQKHVIPFELYHPPFTHDCNAISLTHHRQVVRQHSGCCALRDLFDGFHCRSGFTTLPPALLRAAHCLALPAMEKARWFM